MSSLSNEKRRTPGHEQDAVNNRPSALSAAAFSGRTLALMVGCRKRRTDRREMFNTLAGRATMRIRWKPFLVTMVVALPAAGQEPRGVYLTSPLSLSAGREQKMLTGSGPIDDTVFLLEPPTLSLLRRNPRTAVTLGYRPEFELFASHRNLDAWNHAAGLRLTHAWTRRLSFQLGDSFQATHDPSRWQGGGFFLLPRSNYKENSAYAGMDYALSRQTSLSLRVDHAYTTARLDEAPRLKLLENRSYAGSASLSR